MISQIRWVAYGILGLALSGCASMTREGSLQAILVRSSPPGASIFVDGEKVGQTPEIVEVRREVHPSIELETATGLRRFIFESRYRWGQSFGRNFIFYTLAPFGWLVDLVSGTAWDVVESDPIPIQLSDDDLKNPKPKRPPLIAIAPPQASSMAMSDDGALALEASLRARYEKPGSGQILKFEETLSDFAANDYEYKSQDPSSRRRLQLALGADLIYESKVEADETGWVLRSAGHEVFGAGVKPGPTLRIDRDSSGPRVFGVGFGLQPWWSRILPDTVGLDAVNDQLKIDLAGSSFEMKPVNGDEWWSQGLRYISALNISSTPDRRRSFGSRWELSAVPSVRLSRKRVRIEGLPPPTNGTFIERDPMFLRWSLSAGYGVELGYLFGRHYIYLDAIPMANWSEVSWRQDSANRSATRTGITAHAELGYTYVFDSNWLVRVFSRSQAENTEVWQDAFQARLGDSYRPTAASGVVTGVTFGYRFDTDGYHAVH